MGGERPFAQQIPVNFSGEKGVQNDGAQFRRAVWRRLQALRGEFSDAGAPLPETASSRRGIPRREWRMACGGVPRSAASVLRVIRGLWRTRTPRSASRCRARVPGGRIGGRIGGRTARVLVRGGGGELHLGVFSGENAGAAGGARAVELADAAPNGSRNVAQNRPESSEREGERGALHGRLPADSVGGSSRVGAAIYGSLWHQLAPHGTSGPRAVGESRGADRGGCRARRPPPPNAKRGRNVKSGRLG
ncbi:hypothetical protein T484DRAFT_1928604 [Baffinella frigidus]|nr:hypothetical protein T484DRAFT_1928604 [Cryptophyta sp. CCMP2293]